MRSGNRRIPWRGAPKEQSSLCGNGEDALQALGRDGAGWPVEKSKAATILDEGPQSRNPLSLLDGPERARIAEPQLPLLPAARGKATSSRFFSKYATTRSTISGSVVFGRKPVSASNFSSDGTRRCMSSNPGS